MRGRIIHRFKHSYTIILYLGRDEKTGKYRQKWIAVKGTRPVAEHKMTELIHQYNKTGFLEDTTLTTAEFLDKWITSCQGKLSIRSYERYKQIIRTHFTPDFGQIPLAKLSLAHLQAHYAKIQAAGLSSGTVRYHRAVIHKALQTAVTWGLLFRNVADIDSSDQIKRDHIEMQYWDSEEMNRFLQSLIGNPYYALFYTALFTGMRRSELLGLKWGDVDFNGCQLSVRRSLQRENNGKYYFADVKSKSSKRTIELTPTTIDVLKQHWENSKKQGRDDLVFAVEGKPLRPNTITRAWQAGCQKAGVKVIRFHDARHTHATLLLKQGVHPKIVQERLGHSTIAMTLDIYSHVIPGMQKGAAQKFDNNLITKIDL
jgi:integrase